MLPLLTILMNSKVASDRLPTLIRLHMKELLPGHLRLRAMQEKSHVCLKMAGKIERGGGGGEKKLFDPLSSALREERQLPQSCYSCGVRAFLMVLALGSE